MSVKYDVEKARQILADLKSDIAEQEIIVEWLRSKLEDEDRHLSKLEFRELGIRKQLTDDGVIPQDQKP